MRNSKTHSITLKRQLNKCKTIFYAFSEPQYAYGGRLDNDPEIAEIRCNVKLLGCTEGDKYTTDFYCIKTAVRLGATYDILSARFRTLF
jgi:hypothetical protein